MPIRAVPRETYFLGTFILLWAWENSIHSLEAAFQQGIGAGCWAGLSYALPSMLAATLDVSWDSWEHGTQHLDRWVALRDVRERR